MTGSPPPAALKKLVPKNLSVSNMVTEPARTLASRAISRKAVISQVQTKIGIFSRSMPGARMLSTVAMMLMAPMIELTPIKWMAKMVNAVLVPPCSDSGGYRVQPPAGPPEPMPNSTCRISGISSRVNANGMIQNDQLFMRGSAMSGAPIISGIIQLARPTKAGMTAPKIITKACVVVIWLKNSGLTNCRPGWNSSARMTMAMAPPMKKHHQGEHEVQGTDVLVVGGIEPPLDETLFMVGHDCLCFLEFGKCVMRREPRRFRLPGPLRSFRGRGWSSLSGRSGFEQQVPLLQPAGAGFCAANQAAYSAFGSTFTTIGMKP